MKKRIYSILMMLLPIIAAVMTSCSGDNLEAEIVSSDRLVTGSSKDVSGEASTDTIPVTSNCSWTVTKDVNWIHIKQPSAGLGNGNQSVVFDVDASNLSTSQKGTITIKTSSGIERIITINQRPGTIVLFPSPTYIFFTYQGGEETLEISSNSQWTATSSVDWLKVDNEKSVKGTENPSLTIHADVNNNPSAVYGTITFTDADHKLAPIAVQVEVGGKTPMLVVTPANEVAAVGGVALFGVESNFNWKASVSSLTPAGTETEKWAVFSNGGHSIDGEPSSQPVDVAMTIDENKTLQERFVTVTVTTVSSMGTEAQQTVTIVQHGATLPVVYLPHTTNLAMSEATLTFSATSESLPITECGLLYSTEPEQVMQGVRVAGTLNGEEATATMTNLQSGTTYYVRAYATSVAGSSYSEIMSFRTRLTPGRDDNPNP